MLESSVEKGGNWRIDVHHHFYPREYLGALDSPAAGGESISMPGVRDWSVDRSLEDMEKGGVATSILSLSPPGCSLGGRDENRALARVCNEYAAKLQREHPGRFGHFGVLPMPDVEGALIEIAYALDVLKADGIQLMTSYGNKWPGDPEFDPVLEELNRRGAVVFIHPLGPACCNNLIPWVPAALLEYTQDTNRCIMSLMFSGALAKYPDIRFIFCHGGGSMPFLAGRVMHSGTNRKFLPRVPKGIEYELKKLHYDIAIAAYRPSLSALFELVPKSQVLLGSDFPFHSVANTVSGLDAYGVPEADAQAIYRGNAERLIPRMKSLRQS
jgi:predicted TIM-barrel fold metal-dependent hydrolase